MDRIRSARKRRVQVIDRCDLVGIDADDHVAPSNSGSGCWPALFDRPDERGIDRRQTDRHAEPACGNRWNDGNTEAAARRELTGEGLVDEAPELRAGWEREVKAVFDAMRIQPDELAGGVHHGTAGGPSRERCGVLDAAGDPTSTGASEGTTKR